MTNKKGLKMGSCEVAASTGLEGWKEGSNHDTFVFLSFACLSFESSIYSYCVSVMVISSVLFSFQVESF